MRWLEDRQLSHMLDSARAHADHPGYVALQPIIDLLEAVSDWLTGKRQPRKSRTSLPPL